MLHIRLRSFQQTEADLKEAFYRALKSLRQNDKKEFYSHFWQCLYAAQPLFSDQLSYALNPLNHQYDGFKEKLFSTAEELNTWAVGFASHINQKEIEDLLQGNIHRIFNNLQFDVNQTDDREINWLIQYFIHHDDGLGSFWQHGHLPFKIQSDKIIIDEDFLHAAAYLSFHTGRLKSFAQNIVMQKFKLTPFWSAFLKWHTDDQAHEPTCALSNIVKNKDEKKGKRKTALLLLWAKSLLSIINKIELTESVPELWKKAVPYQGSGMMPVSTLLAKPIRKQEEAMNDLKEEAKKTNPIREPALIEELLGARATILALPEAINKITQPNLRALVFGGDVLNRCNVALRMASLTGKNSTEWNSTWLEEKITIPTEGRPSSRLRRRELLNKEVNSWCGPEKIETPLLLKTENAAVVAHEIQSWKTTDRNMLASLLLNRSECRPWMAAVIGTRHRRPVSNKPCPLCDAISASDGVLVEVLASSKYIGNRPNEFIREGKNGWKIRFEDEVNHLKKYAGINFLHFLIENRGTSYSAQDLYNTVHLKDKKGEKILERADEKQITYNWNALGAEELREKAKSIISELGKENKAVDSNNAKALKKELRQLEESHIKSTGFKFNKKKAPSDYARKASKRVRADLNNAIKKLSPKINSHFANEKYLKKKGGFSYIAEESVHKWFT
jgi:hypothetical protein